MIRCSRRLLARVVAIAMASGGVFQGVVLAQGPSGPSVDAPGRGVARLSQLAGNVSVRRGDTQEVVAAALNGPLVAGDQLQSGASSRAEIQFDWANFVRLAGNTEIRLAELERERYQIGLAKGLATFAMVRESRAEIDINTPSVSIRPLRRGLYRIAVEQTPDGPVTEIAVRSGEAEVASPRGSERLRAGRTMQIRGAPGVPEFRTVSDLSDDEWDRWNWRRDREILRSSAYNYVSRDVMGAEVLDSFGDWLFVPTYGQVWAPRVAAGWAPYRHGRWSWMDYYGWTWISHDPWGWAPFHYGRWFWHSNRWCWWSGGPGIRAFWHPALVAWIGWGGIHLGVGLDGLGWGRVGWVPLAPYEPFMPWYGPDWYGPRGRLETTILNDVNVANVYRNARSRGGVTVVDGRRFGRGAVEAIPPESLDRADLAQGPIPVPPTDRATRVSDQEARGFGWSGAERLFTRRPATPVERVPFEEQRRGMEELTRLAADGTRAAVPLLDRVERTRGVPAREAIGSGGRALEIVEGRDGFRGEESGYRRIGDPGEGWHRVGEAAVPVPPAAPGVAERSRRGDEAWRRFDSSLGSSRADRGGLRGGREANSAELLDESAREEGASAPSERRAVERGTWERFERRGSVGGGVPVGGNSSRRDGFGRSDRGEIGEGGTNRSTVPERDGRRDSDLSGYDYRVEPRSYRETGPFSPRERGYERGDDGVSDPVRAYPSPSYGGRSRSDSYPGAGRGFEGGRGSERFGGGSDARPSGRSEGYYGGGYSGQSGGGRRGGGQ